ALLISTWRWSTAASRPLITSVCTSGLALPRVSLRVTGQHGWTQRTQRTWRKAMDSLHDIARSPFLDLASDLADALVYLDAGSAQFVQANLGASFLLGLGAAHLCDLEHASCQDAQLPEMCGVEVQTLVIAVTRLLTDSHPLVLKACLAHAGVTKVLLLSAVSELAHACIPATALGADAYSEYSQMLQQDIMDSREADASMQGKQGKPEEALHPPSVIHTPVEVVVEVKAFPLHICALDAGAFVLPAACAAATQA
ncbi:uncharacterized protein HaLaN_05820, partial [Haematococcus lacustris]